MTTFCLLHGKWHDPTCWDEPAACLRASGDEVVTPDLLFHEPDTTYAARIAPALDALGDRPAVIVAHSLAAAYAPLIALERPGSSLVYLCPAPVRPLRVDGAPPGIRTGFPFPPLTDDGVSVWDPEAAIEAMYPRVPAAKAAEAAAHLRSDAPARDDYPLEVHPDIPAALVYAADDEFFEPDWSRFTAHEVLGTDPVEIDGGHFPMLADPAGVADLLRRLAAR